MATTRNPNLRVRISADLEDIKKGLGLLRGELSQVKREAQRAMPDMKPFQDGMRQVRRQLVGLFAGVSAGMFVRELLGETGRAQAELAQLRAVLKSTGEAAGISEGQLVDMARNFAAASTFSSGEIIEAQTRLLSYSAIVGEEFPRALQLAIDQSVRLQESLTQSAERVGTALEYPAQGVTSLTRQGFRFSAEQRKLLKELEETGRLAEAQAIVMEVMEESYKGAAEAARQTLPGALAALRNSFKELLDGSGSGGVRQLVDSVNSLADTLNSPEVRQGFADLANQVLEVAASFTSWMAQSGVEYIRMLTRVVVILVANLDLLVVALGTRLVQASAAAAIRLGSLSAVVTALTARTSALLLVLRGKMALLGGPWGIAIAAAATAIYYLTRRTREAKQAQDEHNEALEENRRLAGLSAEAARENAQEKLKEARASVEAARAVLEEARARASAARERALTTHKPEVSEMAAIGAGRAVRAVQDAEAALAAAEQKRDEWISRLIDMALDLNDQILAGGLAEDVLDETGKAIAGSNALLRDAISRQLAELDRMYADHEIGITAYFSKRLALQQASIDAEIEQARMQLAVTKDAEGRRRLEEQIIVLQRDRAAAAIAAANGERQAQEELAESLGEIYLKRIENEGRLAAATRARLEGEYRETIASLQLEGRDDEVRTIRLHINAEVAKAQLSEFQAQMTATLSTLHSTEQSIAAQQQAGLLGVVESERMIKEARTEALIQLQDLRQSAAEFLGTLSADSPEAQKVLEFMRGLDGNLGTVAASMQKFRQQVADTAIDAVSNLFMDLVDGSKSAKDALIDFVRSFVQGMAQIAARALATFLVLSAMDAIWPGFARFMMAMSGGLQVGQYHDGGVVGSGPRVRRLVTADALAQAPRYHNGGIVGGSQLKPNEEFAVLEHGERVRTVEQERALQAQLAAGRGREPVVKTPIVAIGDRAVADALATAAGEEVVLTHVRNNWRALSSGA